MAASATKRHSETPLSQPHLGHRPSVSIASLSPTAALYARPEPGSVHARRRGLFLHPGRAPEQQSRPRLLR